MTTYIVGREIIGSSSVEVLWVGDEQPAEGAWLEVHFRPGSRAPVVGETVDTWLDISERYAIAPLRDARTAAERNDAADSKLAAAKESIRPRRFNARGQLV